MAKGLVAAATGHRWARLPMPRTPAAEAQLDALAVAFLEQLQPDVAVSGMALGWDTSYARAALVCGVPLVAAVPGSVAMQSQGWAPRDVATYRAILQAAAHMEIVGAGYSFARACGIRDHYMVDRAGVVCALWSGAPSGTGNTIRYAERRGLPVVNLYGLLAL